MKNMTRILFAVSVVVGLGACASAASPVMGVLYTDVKYGNTSTELANSRKQGVSCASSILGIFATGDASIEAAKASASITRVSSVDHTATSFLGLYARFCTVIKGE